MQSLRYVLVAILLIKVVSAKDEGQKKVLNDYGLVSKAIVEDKLGMMGSSRKTKTSDFQTPPRDYKYNSRFHQAYGKRNLKKKSRGGKGGKGGKKGYEPVCDIPLRSFETLVRVDMVGSPEQVTEAEIDALTEAFRSAYNDLAYDSCGQGFIWIVEMVTFADSLDGSGCRRRRRRLESNFVFTYKVRVSCNCGSDAPLFDYGSRRQAYESDSLCIICAPTGSDFVDSYNDMVEILRADGVITNIGEIIEVSETAIEPTTEPTVGPTTEPTVGPTYDSDTLQAVMETYPGYSGPLQVRGVVTARFNPDDDSFLFKLNVAGVESDCLHCGVHIHTGTTCDNVLGHYWNAATAGEVDPWTLSPEHTYHAWDKGLSVSATRTGTSKTGFVIDTGTSSADNRGRAVVVDAQDGTRIACGLLQSVPSSASTTTRLLASIGSCPVDEGSLATPYGSIAVDFFSDASMEFTIGSVTGLEANCVKCRVHIHQGTTCDDETRVGSPWWNPTRIRGRRPTTRVTRRVLPTSDPFIWTMDIRPRRIMVTRWCSTGRMGVGLPVVFSFAIFKLEGRRVPNKRPRRGC